MGICIKEREVKGVRVGTRGSGISLGTTTPVDYLHLQWRRQLGKEGERRSREGRLPYPLYETSLPPLCSLFIGAVGGS